MIEAKKKSSLLQISAIILSGGDFQILINENSGYPEKGYMYSLSHLSCIVRSFPGYFDIMGMTLIHAGIGYTDKLRLL